MITSFYPVVMTENVRATASFYIDVLQFETTFDSDWYVSLRRDPNVELAVLDSSHETVPPSLRHPARGTLLNLEVDDVDAEYDRLVVRGGATPLRDIRDEDFGQRHFILAGPDGVGIDIITPITPSAEFADSYAPAVSQ
ncbi:VOC family protein [Rhodococcoides kyotonense]|uniref:Uncharacterized conserved protein PhnB, glyoxalase superfamily n=1 Tax=Rhodococcoides kyotonense TaxID=398843 RepID=A0A239M4H3_9NOCA|nr:Uncharacterized conserved protein PhnB, glyoxalase superfamily [Rhodococcus kyotonensis]